MAAGIESSLDALKDLFSEVGEEAAKATTEVVKDTVGEAAKNAVPTGLNDILHAAQEGLGEAFEYVEPKIAEVAKKETINAGRAVRVSSLGKGVANAGKKGVANAARKGLNNADRMPSRAISDIVERALPEDVKLKRDLINNSSPVGQVIEGITGQERKNAIPSSFEEGTQIMQLVQTAEEGSNVADRLIEDGALETHRIRKSANVKSFTENLIDSRESANEMQSVLQEAREGSIAIDNDKLAQQYLDELENEMGAPHVSIKNVRERIGGDVSEDDIRQILDSGSDQISEDTAVDIVQQRLREREEIAQTFDRGARIGVSDPYYVSRDGELYEEYGRRISGTNGQSPDEAAKSMFDDKRAAAEEEIKRKKLEAERKKWQDMSERDYKKHQWDSPEDYIRNVRYKEGEDALRVAGTDAAGKNKLISDIAKEKGIDVSEVGEDLINERRYNNIMKASKDDMTWRNYLGYYKVPQIATGAGGTLWLVNEMSRRKGQQSNAELYGQQQPYRNPYY